MTTSRWPLAPPRRLAAQVYVAEPIAAGHLGGWSSSWNRPRGNITARFIGVPGKGDLSGKDALVGWCKSHKNADPLCLLRAG